MELPALLSLVPPGVLSQVQADRAGSLWEAMKPYPEVLRHVTSSAS